MKLRLPTQSNLFNARVNGQAANIRGPHNDPLIMQTQNESRFEIVGEFSRDKRCICIIVYAAKTLRTINHKFAGRSASRRTNHGYQ